MGYMKIEELTELITNVVIDMLKVRGKGNITGNSKKKALVLIENVKTSLNLLEEASRFLSEFDVYILSDNPEAESAALNRYGNLLKIDAVHSSMENWLQEFELLFVLNPDIKRISCIAHVIINNLFSELIFCALNKKVGVVINSSAFHKHTENFAPGIRKELGSMVKKIEGYGISFLNESGIPDKSLAKNNPQKRIYTLEDISSMNREGNEICIERFDRLTSLAADYIKEKGIVLKYPG